MISYSVICDANNLYDSFIKSRKNIRWKESTQRFELNLLKNIFSLQEELENKKYKQGDFYEFQLKERGKTRYIKSISMKDKVVQRNLCDNVMIPILQKYLIYDNGASLQHKGVDFSKRRLETHLHKYYRKYGNNGYYLQIDFSKFFDNIQHEKLLKVLEKRIKDEDVLNLIKHLVSSFKVDVSYMNDEDYSKCHETLYNALEYAKIDKSLLTKEKFMDKSVGIGSQISQIIGLYYPIPIDNYCKIVKSEKYYGRYMDDIYILHPDKEHLQKLLKELEQICDEELGLFINKKKTHISKLSKGITYLKVKYILTDTGKVIKRCPKDMVVRTRRKMKKLKNLLDEGKIYYKKIENWYKSRRGDIKKYSSYHILKNLDSLYNDLFLTPFMKGENYGKCKSRARAERNEDKDFGIEIDRCELPYWRLEDCEMFGIQNGWFRSAV